MGNNIRELSNKLSGSHFQKIPHFKHCLIFWLVAHFECSVAHWCRNATFGHQCPVVAVKQCLISLASRTFRILCRGTGATCYATFGHQCPVVAACRERVKDAANNGT